MGKKVKDSATTISSKNQITLPVAALRAAGLASGDRLRVTDAGPGRLIVERLDDIVAEFAGALTGRLDRSALADLDAEWE